MPLHDGSGAALPANPSLPSLREHEIFSAPITGSFQQKTSLDPASQKWAEITIREGVPMPSAGGSKAQGSGVIKLFIGGPVNDSAPRAGGAPSSSLLGVAGSGTNAIGRFNWLGSYRPATGEMIVHKSYAPKAAPRAPAPKAKSPAGLVIVPVPDARLTRGKTHDLTSGGGGAAPTPLPKPSAEDKAVIEFKVSVAPEIALIKDVYLAIRNDKYRPIHFLDPVDTSTEPTYYDVVKKPIWLRQIEAKLVDVRSLTFSECGFRADPASLRPAPPASTRAQGKYKTFAEFDQDMMLVWKNAKLYNSNPEHGVHKDAVYYEGLCVSLAPHRLQRPLPFEISSPLSAARFPPQVSAAFDRLL
jgi:hypothetical protein